MILFTIDLALSIETYIYIMMYDRSVFVEGLNGMNKNYSNKKTEMWIVCKM